MFITPTITGVVYGGCMEFEARGGVIWMDREEWLRRRREQARTRRVAETPEQS